VRLATSRTQIVPYSGRQSQANCTRVLFLHALAARTAQSRQFFESTLPEQLFELKNVESILKI
jgi:hypothetical protein